MRFPSNVPNQRSVHELNVKCASDFKGIECTNEKKIYLITIMSIKSVFFLIAMKCNGRCEAASVFHTFKCKRALLFHMGLYGRPFLQLDKKKRKKKKVIATFNYNSDINSQLWDSERKKVLIVEKTPELRYKQLLEKKIKNCEM